MSRYLGRSSLVESQDEADLRAAFERFAGRGEHIEFRRINGRRRQR